MIKRDNQVFVKPTPGGMVRDPITRRFLDEEGEWKPRNTYWLRRIRMNDVEETKPAKSEPSTVSKSKGSKKENEGQQ